MPPGSTRTSRLSRSSQSLTARRDPNSATTTSAPSLAQGPPRQTAHSDLLHDWSGKSIGIQASHGARGPLQALISHRRRARSFNLDDGDDDSEGEDECRGGQCTELALSESVREGESDGRDYVPTDWVCRGNDASCESSRRGQGSSRTRSRRSVDFHALGT
jgi:hypothetical protein